MLKLKKWFTFGLMATAVALFVPSCTDDDDEDAYRASVTIEGGISVGVALEGEDDSWLQTTWAYSGERVYLFEGYADPGSGHEFIGWTTVPANVASSITQVAGRPGVWQFFMPGYDVQVKAIWDSPAFIPQASIRFTWEADAQEYISSIAASYNDVKDWYDTYLGEDYVEDDATDTPWFDGSLQLPDNIYSSTLGSTANKGKYFEIDDGTYTAICTVEDEFGYFDIVANYAIITDINGDVLDFDPYFEIGFDAGAMVDGLESPDWFGEGWFFEAYDNPNTAPMLQKSLESRKITIKKSNTRTFNKNGAKMELTYYIVNRPKI